jgi:uncharacterized protein (UPF0333 family)
VRKFERGQGATEYLLMLAAVLVIVAIAVYYITAVGGPPPLHAVATLTDNDDVGIDITLAGPRIPKVDWEYAVITTTGTPTTWSAGTKAIGDVVETVTLAANQSTGTYYVWVRHKPTGYIWIDGDAVEV